MDYRSEFSDFDAVTYLNAAGQGPLPMASVRAAQSALEWKKLPHHLPDNLYFDLPDRIRSLLSHLVGGEPDEFAITTGASAGLATVAASLDWKPNDEVLLAQKEFPAHFSTFLPLEQAGRLRMKVIAPRGRFITAEDFIDHLSPQTRLVSASMVRFDDGVRLDTIRLAQECHKLGAGLLLDVSQCAGALPLDLRSLGADFAVGAGYKWLLGPYGTGFFWGRREWLEKLQSGPCYWMALEGARNFHSLPLEELKLVSSARRWDAPETANFINSSALQSSLEFLVRVGVKSIAAHIDSLTSLLIERLPRDVCVLASPSARENRGPYVCVAARSAERTKELYEKLREAQVIVSLRENALRISPHLYNTESDITRLIAALSS